jgi:hypothetical protein
MHRMKFNMKTTLCAAAVLAAGVAAMTPLSASAHTFNLAVYGDAPYGCKAGECPAGYSPDTKDGPNPGDPRQIEATPAFISAINADPLVRLVFHVGDIHSGSQFCTLAYNRTVFKLWGDFKDPLIYTPGDNEWADCHKSGEGGNVTDSNGNYVAYANGDPVANLGLVRQLFFSNPGKTLGKNKTGVISQALAYDRAHPTDAEYVENVMWKHAGVLFVTLNIPGGSNNGDDTWYKAAEKTGSQIQEIAQRTAADLRWLDAARAKALAENVRAVVIGEQADMWDLDGNPATHIANYEPFIAKLADFATAFGKPVLLINGDSHLYRSDNPLMPGQSCTIESGAATVPCSDDAWNNHAQHYNVANFHRLVVHGSTFPLEYLRLTVSPHTGAVSGSDTFGPFSWTRVVP